MAYIIQMKKAPTVISVIVLKLNHMADVYQFGILSNLEKKHM
jgi:hypothetical protein